MSILRRRDVARAGWVLLLLTVAAVSAPAAQAPAPPPPAVPVYVFWGDGCPHCAVQKPFLLELEAAYPQVEVRTFEVWYQPENRALFAQMAARAGFEAGGVPATFIGGRVWVGFHESMKLDMERAAIACIRSGCVDPGQGIVPRVPPPPHSSPPVQAEPPSPIVARPDPAGPAPAATRGVAPDPTADPSHAAARAPTDGPEQVSELHGVVGANVIHLPVIGAVGLGTRSLAVSTALIAFVDGFNPCSLWVLSILLALVLHTGSRRKIALVGSTFLVVTAAVYGLFIVGLFKVFTVVDFLGPVQAIVALLALGFALVNIKDYFWYGRGISFTIADRHKPRIYRDMRGLLAPGKSTAGLLGATVAMALGIALIELPCTAGFPVLWSNLVAGHGVSTVEFSLLLGLYMSVYLLDELVVFGIAVYTLRMSRMEEKHGRVLKLVGGMVMVALAMVLLLDPERMNTLGGSLVVFAAALVATLLVLLVHRRVLPALARARGAEPTQRPERRVSGDGRRGPPPPGGAEVGDVAVVADAPAEAGAGGGAPRR